MTILMAGMFRPARKSAKSGARAIGDLQTAAKFLMWVARLAFLATSANALEFAGSRKSLARKRIASASEFVLFQSEASVCSARRDPGEVHQTVGAQEDAKFALTTQP